MVDFLKSYNPKEDIDKNNLQKINKEKLLEFFKKDINYFINKYENIITLSSNKEQKKLARKI